MPDDVLELIDEISDLRRRIKQELSDVKSRTAAARMVKQSRFRRLWILRHGVIKLTFLSANLEGQAAVHRDIAAWWKLHTMRTKTYRADVTSVDGNSREEKMVMLREIRSACEVELTTHISQLKKFVSDLEMLRQSYEDVLRK